MREIGAKMDISTPEHPQSNRMCKRMMANLVKIMHVNIAEGKEPAHSLQSFLREYQSTPHASTGKSLSRLLMGRNMDCRA